MLPINLKCIEFDVPSNTLYINGEPISVYDALTLDVNNDPKSGMRCYRLSIKMANAVNIGEYDLMSGDLKRVGRMRWEDV